MSDTHDVYRLSRSVLYRIPASSVSYHPELANARVWFVGTFRELPAQGGTMALFQFADSTRRYMGEPDVWLRPFAVVRAD